MLMTEISILPRSPRGQETGFLARCWLDDRGLLKKPGF